MPGEDTGGVVRVVVVDDHAAFRNGVRRLLARFRDVEVVNEAGDVESGVAAIVASQPDVVLLDLHMPDGGGVEVLRRLEVEAPGTPALILTVSAAEADVRRALVAGACGYVVKGAAASELALALHAAAGGEAFVSPRIAAPLLEAVRAQHDTAAQVAVLSDREREVLQLIATGAENGAVAERLCISPNTVKRHVATILEKLGAENRTQAAVLAVRRELI